MHGNFHISRILVGVGHDQIAFTLFSLTWTLISLPLLCTAKCHLMNEKGAVLQVTIELFPFKDLHDFSKMNVPFFTLAINQDVIEVNHNKMPNGPRKILGSLTS